MTETGDERKRLLVKVSTLYYLDGLNQQEISERLGISRPFVSRMLSAARTEGIVKISVQNPYSEEQEYERAIAEIFGIKDAVIHNTTASDAFTRYQQLAKVGSALLESVLKDNDIVGVMAGQSIAALGEEVSGFSRNKLQFVPLVGGWGASGSDWHANWNARRLGEKLDAKYWLLNAPARMVSPEARQVLLQEPEIADVLSLASQSTISLIGIGQMTKNATLFQTGIFTSKDIHEVTRQGAVANICTSFIDWQGRLIETSPSRQMIGVSIAELRKNSKIIAVACGEDKIQAITAALRGRWLDVLVTDLSTAKSVMQYHKQYPTNRGKNT